MKAVCPWLNWGTYEGDATTTGHDFHVRRDLRWLRGGVVTNYRAAALSIATDCNTADLLDRQWAAEQPRQTLSIIA